MAYIISLSVYPPVSLWFSPSTVYIDQSYTAAIYGLIHACVLVCVSYVYAWPNVYKYVVYVACCHLWLVYWLQQCYNASQALCDMLRLSRESAQVSSPAPLLPTLERWEVVSVASVLYCSGYLPLCVCV